MTYQEAQEEVKDDIQIERNRQDAKWGEQNHGFSLWLVILEEELGEMSKAYLENRFNKKPYEDLYTEMVQATAVLQAMCECLVRNTREDFIYGAREKN